LMTLLGARGSMDLLLAQRRRLAAGGHIKAKK